MKTYDNIINLFDTDFQVLFDKQNLVFSKDNPQFANKNIEHGFRTLNKVFDDVNNYDSATIAHHDLSSEKDQLHFQRGIERLNYIRQNNIPILFVNISMEIDNTQNLHLLSNSIIKSGFTNMKILSIYKIYNKGSNRTNKSTLIHECNNYIIYTMPSYGYNDIRDDDMIECILLKHFNFDNLLKIEDF